MIKLKQIDHACNEPKTVALWYGRLFNSEVKKINSDLYILNTGSVEIHFPQRAHAGVGKEDKGTDQWHFSLELTMSEIKKHCDELSIDYKMVQFGCPEPVLFTSDPEGHPIILTALEQE